MTMKPKAAARWAALILTAGLALAPSATQACAACFGKSDTKLAEGLNMGIFALLGCIALVMGWIAGFFVYLSRRAAAEAALTEAEQATGNPTPPTKS
jgi:heme/copper-type cytochrome/quinol oxidase subunit 2